MFGATALKQSPAVPNMLPGSHFENYFFWQAQFCSPITVVILQPNLFVIQLAIGPEIVPVFKRI